MARNKFSTFVYILIGFAIIGLITQLTGNTIGFLTNIIIMAVITAAIFGIIYLVFMKKGNSSSNDEMKKYKKAVKQSKAKYNQTQGYTVMNHKQGSPQKKKRNRRASHLRVIEGNKEKRKDRATN